MRKIKTVTVKAEKKYKVFIGENLLKTCGGIIKAEGLGGAARRILTVCDSNVAPLYFDTLKKSFEGAGLKVYLFTFEAGEALEDLAIFIEDTGQGAGVLGIGED